MSDPHEDGRPSIPTKMWRELSVEISPDIVAGLDVDGIEGLSAKQRRLMTPQKGFLLHKMDHAQGLSTRVTALSLYGELDRAVAGLLPLERIPVSEYKIPDYGNMLYGVQSVAFFARYNDRVDLLEKLLPLLDAPAFYDPLPLTLSSTMLRKSLDFTPEEIEGRSHWTQAMWAESYVNAVTAFARGWVVGGSDEYPPERMVAEVDRYAAALFAMPGYEPFNDRYYTP